MFFDVCTCPALRAHERIVAAFSQVIFFACIRTLVSCISSFKSGSGDAMANYSAWEKYSHLLEGEWLSPLRGYMTVSRKGDDYERVVVKDAQGCLLFHLSLTQTNEGPRIICEGSGIHIRGSGCSKHCIQWTDTASGQDVDMWPSMLFDP